MDKKQNFQLLRDYLKDKKKTLRLLLHMFHVATNQIPCISSQRNDIRSNINYLFAPVIYLKRYYGQTLEVNDDVADRNQDGLTG